MNRQHFIPRSLSALLPEASQRRLVILTGARQTGKTTLARRSYPNLRYVSLDAPENREALRSTPTPVWGRDIGNAILDEAQKEPVVFDKVKFAFDEESITFTLLLGSSQILLLKRIRETLAGRSFLLELFPLSMSELRSPAEEEARPPLVDRLLFDSAPDQALAELSPVLLADEDALARHAEDHLLTWGGMPALLPLGAEDRWGWLRDYAHTYLERDLTDLARLDDLQPFLRFQKLAALRSGRLLNYSELARDAGVSVDTARRYLEYLRISYQATLIQPYYRNLTSSVIKTPKLYWLDLGLLRQISGFRGELPGDVYETMVACELVKWLRTARRDADVYFYRTRSGMEVDLLVETAPGVLAIEVKSREKAVASDFRSLRSLAEALGERWRGGLVVHRGNRIERFGQGLWAVPSRRLFT